MRSRAITCSMADSSPAANARRASSRGWAFTQSAADHRIVVVQPRWADVCTLAPRLTALRTDLERYLQYDNHDRAHTGRLIQGRTVAQVLGSTKRRPTRPPK